MAKRDLKAGEVIDELGGYLVYGEAEAAAETAQSRPPADRRRRRRDGSGATSPRTRPHLRRRRAAGGPPRRPLPRRAGRALRRPGSRLRSGRLTAMARIRFAIVGTGYVADNYMFSARQYPETVEIVRAFDIVPAHAERFRAGPGTSRR